MDEIRGNKITLQNIVSLWDAITDQIPAKKCNNIGTLHSPMVIGEDANAYKVYCRRCKHTVRIGKDWNGAPEKKLWANLFFEDVVQPPHPLFYKLHRDRMSV